MNKINFCVMFVSGAIFAVAIILLSDHFRTLNFSFKNNKGLVYSPLPQEDFLQLSEDNEVFALSKLTFAESDISQNDLASEVEALGSVQVALDMISKGRADMALKLFEHAVALAPKHPEVLTRYGEFLENTKKDVVTADRLYFQALTYSPNHRDAISNRLRTESIVAEIDQLRLQAIDRKQHALAAIPDSNLALRRAKKEAYFSHIYHTVAIEGNTMTLAQTRSVLETKMGIAGKSIDEHNEIIGLDSAMKYINASLINRMGAITVNDILEIHRRVLGHVDPVEGGSMRRTQVYVGGHVPPGPGNLAVLMEKFAQWLNSENANTMHPVRYAALAHYKLVHIHPFTDGNGRTSRLLMNMILMQAGYPPVIILKQHRHLYYENLQLANEGDVRPFVRFIAECTERTLDLFLWATSEFSHEIPALAQEFSQPIIQPDDGSGDEII